MEVVSVVAVAVVALAVAVSGCVSLRVTTVAGVVCDELDELL
jgi:hypothetical protein